MTPAPEAPPAGGAALADIAVVSVVVTAVTLAVLAVVVAYRRGGARPLRLAARPAALVLGVPGWAALPAVLAIGGALVVMYGAVWDIGVHIDEGRDEGPFGTPAHYPFFLGLLGTFLAGVLAVGMAPRGPRAPRSAVRLPVVGPAPAGAVLILAGGTYALTGFPLDDLWHRVFGQDVTLWGPTHTMFFGGVVTAAAGAFLLLMEGARSAPVPVAAPDGRHAAARPPAWLVAVRAISLPASFGALLLFLGNHALDELHWGTPQYRMVWYPLLLALCGGAGLTLARALAGPGGALAAWAIYLPLQIGLVEMIGALGTTRPAFALFAVQAVLVEVLALRLGSRRPVRLGVAAGAIAGTAGFAAEYGWSHLAGAPLPWRPALLPEGLPVSLAAGVIGGLLAGLLVAGLRGSAPRRAGALGLGAALALLVLGLNAADVERPRGATATITASDPRSAAGPDGVRTTVADVRVRLSDPSLAADGHWASALAWQGGGRFLTALEPAPDGSLVARGVPVGGGWKAMVRFHRGRTLAAAPVRMPADAAVGFPGFALPVAGRPATRDLVLDTELLQLERKDDGPTWAWTPAVLLVMAMNLALLGTVGVAAARLGRTSGPAAAAGPPAPTTHAPERRRAVPA